MANTTKQKITEDGGRAVGNEIIFHHKVEQLELNGKICYKYGALILAQDESIAPIRPVSDKIVDIEKVQDDAAFVHLRINGIDFIDYAHTGKNWQTLLTVWNDKLPQYLAKNPI